MKKLFLTLALTLYSTSAIAQAACKPHDEIVNKLETGYKEVPIAIGVSATGQLIEIITNEDTGTFTIVVTDGDKTSCLAASGFGFRVLSDSQRNALRTKSYPGT